MAVSIELFGLVITVLVAVLSSLAGLIWRNNTLIEDQRARFNELKARLYGKDRGDSGDVNSVRRAATDNEKAVAELREELDAMDIEAKLDRIIERQEGVEGIESRPGILNELHRLREQLETMEDKMDHEHEWMHQTIRELAHRVDAPTEDLVPGLPHRYRDDDEDAEDRDADD